MGRKRDKERLLEAAGRHDAIKAVYELALSFREKGMQQAEMMNLFMEVHSEVDDDGRIDALCDTMDYISGGPWAKGNDLFPTELREEDMI
mmetsp:Transcript_61465/g.144629  ORF Transcript_61465/g.144629 Transcript_61465/m.144629 type:complete len:90 (+) Transcript_61465:91-360(+)